MKGQFAHVMKDMHYHDVEIIVITDGSRILGLGDLGSNGVGISIGKTSLYVAGAGIHPMRAIPVVMDCGTNTEKYLTDKNYLGTREKRLADETFYSLMDEFMEGVKEVWPTAVIQFEDFSNNHCFDMLERYQNKYRCFNDDIQGTGAVVAAGFMNAIRISNLPPVQQRVVVFGAGSAAVGVCTNIAKLGARLYNTSVEEVMKIFYLVDTKGLVTTTRGDKLAAHKVPFARTDVTEEQSKTLTDLLSVVKFVKPTALLGLGGVGPVFTEEIVKIAAAATPRPIIFPLSNPTSKSECIPEDAYKWTDGKALIASGSPFPSTTLSDGRVLTPSQGNNLYVFPGIGLGCAMCMPDHIPDELLIAASASLNTLTLPEHLEAGMLYPPLKDIHAISANIATDVILEAMRLGINKAPELPTERAALMEVVKSRQWVPYYPEDIVIEVNE
ncbi:malate dehydrogenase (oxaloacetate-decarboxylating) [Angomonas deanei]|nr:malate dehydrogenase (oxaloacetate-decarboxylating) [Angomonas deanei]|eukprot:EPY31287.1 malate dehydrogenase (oxaloacetate-decarboxylating) [Angomonas deanei]